MREFHEIPDLLAFVFPEPESAKRGFGLIQSTAIDRIHDPLLHGPLAGAPDRVASLMDKA